MNIFDEKLHFEEEFSVKSHFYEIKFNIIDFDDFKKEFGIINFDNESDVEISFYKCIDQYFEKGGFLIDIAYNTLDGDLQEAITMSSNLKAELSGNWKYERLQSRVIIQWKTPYWFEKSNCLSLCDLGELRMRIRGVYVDS
jgi:hypothetical protein